MPIYTRKVRTSVFFDNFMYSFQCPAVVQTARFTARTASEPTVTDGDRVCGAWTASSGAGAVKVKCRMPTAAALIGFQVLRERERERERKRERDLQALIRVRTEYLTTQAGEESFAGPLILPDTSNTDIHDDGTTTMYWLSQRAK
jgi:hypothetical protein